MNDSPLILIVDDEQSICDTLEQVLSDEGYRTCDATDGVKALEIISEKSPNLVLLDIWMPGMDGMEVLKKIRADHPDIPVVMISGHATISTAVKATQFGAIDFIEKPLDLENIMRAVTNALGHGENGSSAEAEPTEEQASGKCQITPVAFAEQKMRGEERPQRTLASSSLLYGLGVHSGQKSGLILEPLPENSGIHFAGLASHQAVPAYLDFVGTTGYATTIKYKDNHVGTIEHLLSALHAYGITNLLVKCNEEVPVMDGSSQEFCRLIEEIGVENQKEKVYEIKIEEKIEFSEGDQKITLEPADSFIIDYTLRYPEPIGEQHFVFELKEFEDYKKEIAPSRTFVFVQDVEYLQSQGLAQGGRFNNFVLIGEGGVINSELRFENEAVRHKILDIIGDLYLLGRPIRGKVTAEMTGHSDNINILRLVHEQMKKAKA